MSCGVADEDRSVADPRVSRDVLDHLGVVVGGEEGLALAAVGHREEADEVGHPRQCSTALELRVLVPEVVDVPRLVADHEVVVAVLDDLLEHHEVGHEDLVHAAQRLEAVQVVTARFRGHVCRFTRQPPARRVDTLALRFQHSRDRVLGQPVDLEVGASRGQLLGDGDVAPGVAEPDRRREVQRSPGP